MEDLIPVTIITGFLGAGKTTLLNRILTDEHGQKIAVIENEFGEESIDNDLLVQSEDEEIITMNNGCICCTIRGDLAENLIRLMERKKEGKANFDRVIIETTGLADPGPVAQTFFMDEEVAQFYMVDGVITVVDAVNGPRTLDEQAPAQAQVGFADRILLSKVDLVPPSVIEDLSDRLHHMNPRAPIVECNMGNVDIKEVLDIRGFNLDSVLELDPDFLKEAHEEGEHHHHHEDGCTCGCHDHHDHDHEEHEHHHDHDHDHEEHEHHHDHDHDHEHDENCTCGCHDHEHHHHHHADDVFTSWGKETPHKFERAKLEEVLKKFVDSDNILRSKGMVESTDGTWLYFDMVPGEYEIREGEPDYTGRIVVIGTEIHEDELLKTFGL